MPVILPKKVTEKIDAMKKSRLRIGALIMTTMITVGLLIPLSSYGQGGRTDGFFSNGSNSYENRDEEIGISGGVTNDSFGAPLGSGLLVLVAAGACYAAVKLKKRRIITVVAALVIVLGTTQCKKKEVIPYSKKAYNITLDVGDGARTNVNPLNGTVSFEDGDMIIVANNGCYVGTLVYADGAFCGTITDADEDDYLHFYHLGNRYVGELEEGISTGCSVSIADQAADLPVISYAPSTVKFSSDVTNYTARLQNKCALVKFDVTNGSSYAGVCITDMRNRVDVDFVDAEFSYSMENDGKITLASGSGERWAILLPQPLAAAGEVGSAFSGTYEGIRGAVPEIKEDDYLTDGITITAMTKMVPECVHESLFTVNEDGKQVYFSKGNLYYLRDTQTWKFYEIQYIRAYNGNISYGYDYGKENKVEHFGWGTSGFNHGAVVYEPWRTSNVRSQYYAYGDVEKNLYDETCKADWGYNMIENAGNAYKQWRAITTEEMQYILRQRDDASDKYSYGTIKIGTTDYLGLIILPDNWEEPYDGCFNPGITNSFTGNIYTDEEWAMMEENGALFLPCSGRRNTNASIGVGQAGLYWTSNVYDSGNAICVMISSSSVFSENTPRARGDGLSVRMVIE